MNAPAHTDSTPSPDGVFLGLASNYTSGTTPLDFEHLALSTLALPVLLTVVLGRRTVAGICDDALGIFDLELSSSVVVNVLHELRQAGFVDWVDGRHASIRSLLAVVPPAAQVPAGRAASPPRSARPVGVRSPGGDR